MTRLRFVMVVAVVIAITVAGWLLRARLVSAVAWVRDTPPQFAAAPPAAADAAGGISRRDVSIDLRRQQLIGVRTAIVTRSSLGGAIRAVGAVRYDETRLSDVSVRVEGWIRELYVDSTGQTIQAGQPLFTLYSPTVIGTESEYLLALKARDQLQQSPIADARDQADRLVSSARQKLRLWDVPADAVQALDDKRQTEDTVTFRAPRAGVITEKTAVVGLHIVPGQSLYKIADLSVVWVEAELYENELSLIRRDQSASVTLDAYPAERFAGRVAYIYPYLDEKTRTNRVRIALDNPAGRLKPGMFANVELQTGSASAQTVPVDAVLDSGTEQLVFVSQGDGHFAPRHVKVGRRVGGDIQILDGLKDGEAIATAAAFFLDSESQLRAGLTAYESPATSASSAAPSATIAVTFLTEPSPPTTGENVFLVTVRDRDGTPIADADVSVLLLMPAMPTMNMPAMRNEVKLTPAGGGEYRGTGQVMMAGRWDATVVVSKAGQRLGSTQTTLAAR